MSFVGWCRAFSVGAWRSPRRSLLKRHPGSSRSPDGSVSEPVILYDRKDIAGISRVATGPPQFMISTLAKGRIAAAFIVLFVAALALEGSAHVAVDGFSASVPDSPAVFSTHRAASALAAHTRGIPGSGAIKRTGHLAGHCMLCGVLNNQGLLFDHCEDRRRPSVNARFDRALPSPPDRPPRSV